MGMSKIGGFCVFLGGHNSLNIRPRANLRWFLNSSRRDLSDEGILSSWNWAEHLQKRPSKMAFFHFFHFWTFFKNSKNSKKSISTISNQNTQIRSILGQKRDSWSFSPLAPREHPQIDDFRFSVWGPLKKWFFENFRSERVPRSKKPKSLKSGLKSI